MSHITKSEVLTKCRAKRNRRVCVQEMEADTLNGTMKEMDESMTRTRAYYDELVDEGILKCWISYGENEKQK